jgi:hypothetical protein
LSVLFYITVDYETNVYAGKTYPIDNIGPVVKAATNKKSDSNKSSGSSSRYGAYSPSNYASMTYSGGAEVQSQVSTNIEDNTKYFKLLQKFGGSEYRFCKSGTECTVMQRSTVIVLFSFPYTKTHLRNACFLFLNEKNIKAYLATEKVELMPDCSGKDSPYEFTMFD